MRCSCHDERGYPCEKLAVPLTYLKALFLSCQCAEGFEVVFGDWLFGPRILDHMGPLGAGQGGQTLIWNTASRQQQEEVINVSPLLILVLTFKAIRCGFAPHHYLSSLFSRLTPAQDHWRSSTPPPPHTF